MPALLSSTSELLHPSYITNFLPNINIPRLKQHSTQSIFYHQHQSILQAICRTSSSQTCLLLARLLVSSLSQSCISSVRHSHSSRVSNLTFTSISRPLTQTILDHSIQWSHSTSDILMLRLTLQSITFPPFFPTVPLIINKSWERKFRFA